MAKKMCFGYVSDQITIEKKRYNTTNFPFIASLSSVLPFITFDVRTKLGVRDVLRAA